MRGTKKDTEIPFYKPLLFQDPKRVEAWMARASAGISHQGAEPKPAPTEKPETAEPVEPEIEAPAEPLPVVHVEAWVQL